MTHEFENILLAKKASAKKAILATLVDVSGSSYRGPDARMLVFEDGRMVGALSGGCVEKEILRQATLVFKEQKPLLIEYDGRYRLGCEGVLHILLEPFEPSERVYDAFEKQLQDRQVIEILCQHPAAPGWEGGAGSFLLHRGERLAFRNQADRDTSLAVLHSILDPKFRLLIFGGEHDAAALSRAALPLGWEVMIINPPDTGTVREHFPDKAKFVTAQAGTIPVNLDGRTAIMLMSHNYARDLSWLVAFSGSTPLYLGLLGPVKRREQLLHEMLERTPEVSDTFLDRVYGPAGLNLGAITPEEIALSVLSEILSVMRDKQVFPLREKTGKIHQ